jgi:hypothetical protein
MMKAPQQMFSEQQQKAFNLGRRMAEAGFSLQDNPFTNVHPRFSACWSRGFQAVDTLRSFGAAIAQRESATRQKVANAF